MSGTDRAPGPARDRAVLALIPLVPFAAGLAMLEPGRNTFLGLATTAFALIGPAMLIAWPEIRRTPWPGGRTARLVALVFGAALVLAVTKAVLTGFSLTLLGFWAAAFVAGRAVQLRIRAADGRVAARVLLAILVAGPLYALLLPLMEMVYGASHQIDWTRDMPGLRHIRKMGHLYTASAAAGLGLVLTGAVAPRPRMDRLALLLTVLALGLAIWSGARGAWLALTLALALAMLRAAWGGGPMRPLRTGLAVLAAILLALALPVPGPHLGVLSEIGTSAAELSDINQLSSNRLKIWADAVTAIRAEPLTGHGWGQYDVATPRFHILHAHNLPLDLLLGLGIPLGLGALALMLHLWATAWRRTLHAAPQIAAALPLLDTMALYSLVSGTYFYGIPVVLTGIAWGICLSPRPATD